MKVLALCVVAGLTVTLTATEPVRAQDMSDAATRERVAGWMERCDGFSEACWPAIERIEESALGRWCRTIGTGRVRWDAPRVLRDPERELRSIEEDDAGWRRKVEEFLLECVPIYAVTLDSQHADSPTPAEVRSGPVDPHAGPVHGSIAFSQDDGGGYAWGIAWSFDSSAGAQVEALGQCREYGGTRYAEVGWFQDACGALAIGGGNGYGWGATTAAAERDALAQCRASNNDCRIEVARCSQSEQAGGRGRQQEAPTRQEPVAEGRDKTGETDDGPCEALLPFPGNFPPAVAWTGDCIDGKADGRGRAVWCFPTPVAWADRYGEAVGETAKVTYEGVMRSGKAQGIATVTNGLGEAIEMPFRDGKTDGPSNPSHRVSGWTESDCDTIIDLK